MTSRRSLLVSSVVTAIALSLPGVEKLRKVEVFTKGWREISWSELKRGMVFRLREPTGEITDEGQETEIAIAMTDATPDDDPRVQWGLEVHPFTTVGMDHPVDAHIGVFKDGVQLGMVQKINLRTLKALVTSPEGEGSWIVPFDELRVALL